MGEFYCQFCGAKVGLNSNSCNNCHREFESVLCPKCLYSGSDNQFKDGCPNCGYLKSRPVINKKINSGKTFSLKRFLCLFLPLLISTVILLILLIK